MSHFNVERHVPLEHINVCYSYPYIEQDGSRRYLLFYRWAPWLLLVIAGIYYIPRKVSKYFDNAECTQLLQDLANNAHENQGERGPVEKAYCYVLSNIKTHNGLYWKYQAINVLALLTDIFAMLFLNIILQGRFIQYGFKAHPFQRDSKNFSDYMSQTFPPFASCELSSENQLVFRRVEKYGCHLTMMELYEKLYLGIWFWIIIQALITCCYIIFLFTIFLPCVKSCLLMSAKPAFGKNKVREIIKNVSIHCKIGDVYLLYRIKSHLSHVRFYELMTRLSDPNLLNKQGHQTIPPGMTPENKDEIPPNEQKDTTSNYRPNVTQDPPINLEMMSYHPQHHPEQNMTPPKKDNTSIDM